MYEVRADIRYDVPPEKKKNQYEEDEYGLGVS